MQTEFIIVILLLIATLGAVGFLVFRILAQKAADPTIALLEQLNAMRKELYEMQDKGRVEMQSQLGRVNDQVYKGMSDSQKAMQTQFAQTSKIIEDITLRLTTLDATNKQVLDFSSQLQNLQDILKNPKHRGILGEYFLETALKNVLSPEHYKMQYKFANGEIVDAAVLLDGKIIPIDSKFSLENYNRLAVEQNPEVREKLEKAFLNDLKLRIQETAKYIRPEEGTMDFAFMFIPHEAVYYDLLVNKIGTITDETDSLIARAASKYKVIIVSPTSFFAFLQTVLQGLRALKIEESALMIQKQVEELGKHMRAYSEYHGKVAKNLSTTVNQFNLSSNELRKVSKDVNKITAGKGGEVIEIEVVDTPVIE
ncbi:MAG TPA: DNA recombination protein RmuC [bacterium]|nr:DNA recombination protein RmuC [bacterium]